MKIKVTQEHIDLGTPKFGEQCPIAYAINEATGKRVTVGGRVVWFTGDKRLVPLTGIASYFVITYDCGCNVSPFEFDFDYELPPKLADMDLPEFATNDLSAIELECGG